MPRTSLAADIAATTGILAILAVAFGPAAVHLGWFSPIRGFAVFALGLLPGSLLAFSFGLAAFLRTKPASGHLGRGRAWIGLISGTALLLLAGFLVFEARHAPPIHDITTNPADPPAFSEPVRAARTGQNGVDYPDGGHSVPEMQQRAYPDMVPILLHESPATVLDETRRAAEMLGWKVTRVDPTEGRVEAYEVSRVFRFIDDIVIRVRPEGTGSVVDVRSSSRVGVGDVGKNVARIRAFRRALPTTNEFLFRK